MFRAVRGESHLLSCRGGTFLYTDVVPFAPSHCFSFQSQLLHYPSSLFTQHESFSTHTTPDQFLLLSHYPHQISKSLICNENHHDACIQANRFLLQERILLLLCHSTKRQVER